MNTLRASILSAATLLVASLFAFGPEAASAQSQPQKVRVLDDFSRHTVGRFPSAPWQWRRDRDTGDAEKARKDEVAEVFDYVIREENGNKYLHVRDEHKPGHSVSVFIDTEDSGWVLAEYPVLSWRWRVNEIPPGADERFTETNDTPASISVVYGTKFPFTPITIKWAWSSTLPVGAVAYRPGRGRAHTIVLGSGNARLGEWITIERNIFDDYVSIHGKLPPDKPRGIVISSDANRTPGGAADADYDDIKILSRYSPGFPKQTTVLLKEYMKDNRD